MLSRLLGLHLTVRTCLCQNNDCFLHCFRLGSLKMRSQIVISVCLFSLLIFAQENQKSSIHVPTSMDHSTETPPLSRNFFGVPFGINEAEMVATCRVSKTQFSFNRKSFSDKDYPATIMSIRGAPNGNKAVSTIDVHFFNGLSYECEVFFSDYSEANFLSLNIALLEKGYDQLEDTISDAINNRHCLKTKVDGYGISVQLQKNILEYPKPKSISIIYTYDKMQSKLSEELSKRKASKVKNDL